MGVESVITAVAIYTAYRLYIEYKIRENEKKTMKKIFEERKKEILELQKKRKERLDYNRLD